MLIFVIFVAAIDYENIFTMKISRFTVFKFPFIDGCTKAVDSVRWQSDKDGHSVHSEGSAAEGPLQQRHSGGAQQRREARCTANTQVYC